MANYYGFTRTNHFSVTDPEKLTQIVNRIRWDEGELIFLAEEDGRFCFGAYSAICGLVKPAEEADSGCDDDEYEPESVYAALQEIVAPDDAIIITEVGFEKLRYLTAYAMVITRDGANCVELRGEALNKAQAMLHNPQYATKMEY